MGDVYTDILCEYGKQSHTTIDSYHVKKTAYLGFIVGENGIVDLLRSIQSSDTQQLANFLGVFHIGISIGNMKFHILRLMTQ
jgi:hypothetical protein